MYANMDQYKYIHIHHKVVMSKTVTVTYYRGQQQTFMSVLKKLSQSTLVR